MNAATEFDLGPLTWVKGEIDQALQKAEEALRQYEATADTTQLKFCRTHLHQAHGALAMVGLDGVTPLTESAESLLYGMEDERLPSGDSAIAALRKALFDLRQYLDDLMAGEPNQPLRLMPAYSTLAGARGLPEPHPGDLFTPDLSVRPPKRSGENVALGADALLATLKAERSRFQKGLLAWLTRPDQSEAGRQQMRDAVAAIEAVQPTPMARSFWWIARAFLEALGESQVANQQFARQLCSRIDLQIRRLLEGSSSVAERVMREALYYVARVPGELDPSVAEVQSAFGLKTLVPDVAIPVQLPQENALRRLREALVLAEESWSKFCNGNTTNLPNFAEQTRICSQLTDEIGQMDLKRLGQGLAAIANWLVEDAARFNDTVAMEVATAILLMHNAQESFKRLGTDFAQQVDLMVARLYACIAGRPAMDDALPLLDEMTRRAQEKLLVAQVGKEIQNNLAQIEQTLDGFFRDPSRGQELLQLDGPMKQIGGALAMLGHFGALASLKDCGLRIQQFAEPGYLPSQSDFEAVADELSLIGFFVDSLQNGETDFDAFVARLRGAPATQGDAAEEAETESAQSVEVQLAQQARDTQALAEALREAPDDLRLQDELKHNLQSIQKDADLVANRELGDSAKAALAALESGGAVDEALNALAPQAPETPQPSAETLQLADATHDVIDAELLSIFIEEAHEVLATIGDQKALLATNPGNVDALTTIRRSTHTLKGSGRMVGLTDLGETAWELEQTLNLWLRQDLAVTPELLAMIDLAHQVFGDWVEHLQSRQGQVPDVRDLVAIASRLRGVEVPAEVATPPADIAPLEVAEGVLTVDADAMPMVSEEIVLPALDDDFSAEFNVEPALQEPAAFEADVAIDAELGEIPEVAAQEQPADDGSIALGDMAFDMDLSGIGGEAVSAIVESNESPIESPLLVADMAESVALTDLLPGDVSGSEEDTGDAWSTGITDENTQAPVQTITVSPTLYDIFREEARGHLQTLVDSHAMLAAHPAAPTTFEMTRAAHTLGGIAATVGLMPLHHLAIALEHALLRRDGSAQLDSIEGLETVRQTIMTLQGMFDDLAQQRAPDEQPQLISALEEIYHPAPVIEAPDEPVSAEIIPLPGLHLVDVSAEPSSEVSIPEVPDASLPATPALPQLVDELDEQLLPIFLEEAVDLTRGMAEQLAAWRADPAGGAAPHALARILHTFKGSARMAGAMNLGEATHLLEARVEDISRTGQASAGQFEEIEGGCDALAQAVERLRAGPSAVEEPPEPVMQEGAPAMAPAIMAVHEPEAESDTAQRATLRVRADLIDRLVNEAGELSIARARIEGEMRSLKGSLLELTENVIRLRRQLRDIEIQAETQIQARVAHTPEGQAEFDPLELDRFTRFQELTRFMAESVNDVATVQQNLLKNLDDANAGLIAQARLNRSLQQELMGVRMLPFASQTERLFRIVRQTAKETGKRASLDIVGGQVDIDRSVLDKMLAPLEHMLRNAVTHGIEDREQRLAAGKQETGEILIKLVQEGNEIILSMSDDGRGLDAARIRARAEAMGLLQPGQVADDATLYDFVFQAGFSTAAELTQLAGRGVGMDVVKTEVGELGGRIEIETRPGQGTTFRLYLPLTLAVTQTLLVRVGNHMYAVPSTMIEQVMEVKEHVLDDIRAKGEATWQDNRYPFHFLPHLLGDSDALPEAHRQYWVLLLRSGAQRVAVLVDELKGNQEVVVKNIGAQLARVVGIAGATVLGDGRVVLILNPVALASRTPVTSVHLAVPTMAQPVMVEQSSQPTVMVVDDSLTVRKITSRLLAREGYQVVLAKDGVDALEQLIEVMPDVILSDIEMPRMDGFDFVRNVRADERLRRVPIIMITSRTADKHRNYALEIGANHYLGKPYDEAELLSLVAGYCHK